MGWLNLVCNITTSLRATSSTFSLVRRVIPRDIVGGHVRKLKQMDAMVHGACSLSTIPACLTCPQIVFYEVSGTGGAFACSVLIDRLGNNYAFLATPACYFAAGVIWWFVDSEFSEKDTTQHTAESDQPELEGEHGLSCGGYISGWVTIGLGNTVHPANQSTNSAMHGFKNFGRAVWYGAWVVFSTRKFIWLVPAYSFALFGHRYVYIPMSILFPP